MFKMCRGNILSVILSILKRYEKVFLFKISTTWENIKIMLNIYYLGKYLKNVNP